jgi:hypothetical protein
MYAGSASMACLLGVVNGYVVCVVLEIVVSTTTVWGGWRCFVQEKENSMWQCAHGCALMGVRFKIVSSLWTLPIAEAMGSLKDGAGCWVGGKTGC